MKYLIAFSFVIYLLASCDPPTNISQSAFIFPVTVVNPKDTINLGDSVCFIFQIPDTINLNGSNKIKPYYGNNDGASFPVAYNEVDTTFNAGYRPFSPNLKEYAEPGTTLGGVHLKVISSSKLYTKYYLIPKKRGVYFLDLQQAGYVNVNNGSLKLRASYTFTAASKNHHLLISSTLPRHNMQATINARTNQGFEIYAFAVK